MLNSRAEKLDYQQEKDNRDLGHIPGSYGWPFVGHAPRLLDDLYEVADEQYKKYGRVSRFALVNQRGLLVLGADNTQEVLLDKHKNFSSKMGYDKTLGSIYNDNILLTDGADHKTKRRMFQTAFKTDAMRTYVNMINEVVARRIPAFGDIQGFCMFPEVKLTLLDNAAKVFVGIDDLDGDDAKKLNQSFHDATQGLLALIRKDIPGTKYSRGLKGIKYQKSFFKSLIDERRKSPKSDILSFLANECDENGELFAVDAIINEMMFLLFAAHDTTTSAITNMAYFTSADPKWQDRMYAEFKGLGKDKVEYDDLGKLSDTEMVFNEALRIYPSVPWMSRRTIRECTLDGYRIPANTIVWLAPTYSQMIPEYWTNVNTFDPERFSPERAEHKKHPFMYTPFGGGIHKCIGMHFGMMTAKIFMQQFVLSYKYQAPQVRDPKVEYFPLPKPKDNVPLTLTRR